jgi:hypothetical protein
VISTALSQLVLRATLSFSVYQTAHLPVTLLHLAGAVLLSVGAGLLASKRRPGHPLSRLAAVAFGLGAASSLLFPLLGALGVSLTAFRVVSFLSALVTTAGTVALGLSLRTLAQSRARNLDLLVLAPCGLLVLPLLSSLLGLLGVHLPSALSPAMSLTSLLARGALAFAAFRVLLADGIQDPQFLPGSAYRGPEGAVDNVAADNVAAQADTGSLPLGFLAGFFGGFIGLIIVRVAIKKPDTQRGATIGFVSQIVLGFVLRIALR